MQSEIISEIKAADSDPSLTISKSSDIDNILNTIHPLQLRSKKIEFSIQSMSLNEKQKWEKRINRNYNACGCITGEIFVVLGITTIIMAVIFKPFGNISPNGKFFLFSGGILLVLALLGKFTGLLYSHFLLKHDLISLKKLIKN